MIRSFLELSRVARGAVSGCACATETALTNVLGGQSRASAQPKAQGKGRVSERVLEARRDFDEALERIKSRGGRRRGGSQLDSTDPIVWC